MKILCFQASPKFPTVEHDVRHTAGSHTDVKWIIYFSHGLCCISPTIWKLHPITRSCNLTETTCISRFFFSTVFWFGSWQMRLAPPIAKCYPQQSFLVVLLLLVVVLLVLVGAAAADDKAERLLQLHTKNYSLSPHACGQWKSLSRAWQARNSSFCREDESNPVLSSMSLPAGGRGEGEQMHDSWSTI